MGGLPRLVRHLVRYPNRAVPPNSRLTSKLVQLSTHSSSFLLLVCPPSPPAVISLDKLARPRPGYLLQQGWDKELRGRDSLNRGISWCGWAEEHSAGLLYGKRHLEWMPFFLVLCVIRKLVKLSLTSCSSVFSFSLLSFRPQEFRDSLHT